MKIKKQYNVKFEKIENNHSRLRDDVIIGTTDSLPVVRVPFCMTAPPRDGGIIRVVNTSPVKEILSYRKGVIEFSTQSGSIYKVTIL